jgi:AcrR family transcriptional regulator
MRKTQHDTEISIERILLAAEEVFCQRGFAAARMDDIAGKAGMTKGAIFWHFESKAGLLKALCKRAVNRLREIFNEEFSTSAPIMDKCRKILVRIHKDRAFEILLLLGNVLTRDDATHGLLEDSFKEISDIFQDALRNLQDAKTRGEIKPDTNVTDILMPIVLTMSGFARIRELQTILGPVSKDIDGEEVINNIFKGLLSFQQTR